VGVTPLEDVSFVGRVVSQRTGAPIASAQVRLGQTGQGALTDADGRYAFHVARARLPDGEHRLIAELIGYQAREKTVRVPRDVRGDTVRVDFTLRQESVVLHELNAQGRPASAQEARRAGRPSAPIAADASAWSAGQHRGRCHRHPDWNRASTIQQQLAVICRNDGFSSDGRGEVYGFV
jgi:hypothetical protein